jgi:hypothetical protein
MRIECVTQERFSQVINWAADCVAFSYGIHSVKIVGFEVGVIEVEK